MNGYDNEAENVLLKYIFDQQEKISHNALKSKKTYQISTNIKKIFRRKPTAPFLKAESPIGGPINLFVSLRNRNEKMSIFKEHVDYIINHKLVTEETIVYCQKYMELSLKSASRRSLITVNGILDLVAPVFSGLIVWAFLSPYLVAEISKGILGFMFVTISAVVAGANMIKTPIKPFIEESNSFSLSAYEYWLGVLETSIALKKLRS